MNPNVIGPSNNLNTENYNDQNMNPYNPNMNNMGMNPNMNNMGMNPNMYNQPQRKKKKSGLIFLIIILCLISGIIGYKMDDIISFVNSKIEKKEDSKNENKPTETPQVTETDITDSALINDLSSKVNMLSALGNYTYPMTDDTIFFTSANDNKTFTDNDKLLSIIVYYNYYDVNIKKEAIPESVFKTSFPEMSYETDNVEEDYQLDGLTINNIYKALYNVDIPNKNVSIDGCPTIKYDATNNKYLVISRCGGVNTNKILKYNYKYTKDDNNAYVYVSVGYKKSYENDYDETIYSDLKATKLYKQNKEDQNFLIDSKNYKDFEQYKVSFTFAKDTNNYYFNKIEKVTKDS